MEALLLTCKKCGREFPPEPTFWRKDAASKNGLRQPCHECFRDFCRSPAERQRHSDRLRRWRSEHPQAQAQKIWRQRWGSDRPQRARAMVLLASLKTRVRRESLPFDRERITLDYLERLLIEHPNCECCGRRFDLRGGDSNSSPSIDKVIPSEGYVVDNIALLCWRCNRLKFNATLDELEKLVAWLRSRTTR
jgi:hypothetical protein